MLLSVTEAATLLGVQPRTVRARLAKGELPGRKQDGQWVIPRAALPLTESQHRALQARADEIRETVDAALPPRVSARRDRARRSLVDLDVFRAVHAAVARLERPDHASLPRHAELVSALEQAGAALAVGFHEYRSEARLQALTETRAALARVIALVLLPAPLPPAEPALGLVDLLEQEALPGLAGLFRQAERPPGPWRGRS